MARLARVVIPRRPHHVTSSGNRRQKTFFGDADHGTYLHMAAEAFAQAGVEIGAYCLTPNPVHLIAFPSKSKSLARAGGGTDLS